MDGVNSRWPLLCTALLAGLLVTGSTPSQSGAEAAPGLSSKAQSLRRAESSALLDLYAAESALGRARDDLQRLAARSAELELEEQSARHEAEIVRRSLAASQVRIASLLRDLYVQGEPDAIAIVFGATSLDEAITGIEGLKRATSLNERLGEQATRRAKLLVQVRKDLASRLARLDGARAEARAAEQRLAAAVSAKRASVATIREQRALTEQRLETLQAQAQQAEQRSAKITAAATIAASSASGQSAPPSAPTTRDDDAVRHTDARRRRRRLPPAGVDRERPPGRCRRDRGRPERDPARHSHTRPRLRPCGGRRRRQCGEGEHHRPLDAEHEAGARLGTPLRHDHDLRLSR